MQAATNRRRAEPLADNVDFNAYMAETEAPPYSIEAEQSVLGSLLAGSPWPDPLAPGDFFLHQHRLIAAATADMATAGERIDPITAHQVLQRRNQDGEAGGFKYLSDLLGGAAPGSLETHAEVVRRHAQARRNRQTADGIVNLARRLADPNEFAAAAQQLLNTQGKEVADVGIPLLSTRELREREGLSSWLVKHVIPSTSIGALFGASGTFKSFIGLDLSLHVASGLQWMGRRTTQAKVLYVAAEGGAGLWRRIDAWHRERGLALTEALYTVPIAIDLSADAAKVVQAAKRAGVQPGLVVVDTLSQTYSGDENAAHEMAAYLRSLGQHFRDTWNCAVLLLHHSGHSAVERPRGSSAFGANLDFMLGVHRDERELLATVSCAKAKDCEPFSDAAFQLRRVELGTDEDGDPVTSLVAWHLSTQQAVQQAEREEAAAGRAGRSQSLLGLIQNGQPEKSLRHAFYELLGDMPADSKKKAFYRARDRAIEQGLIEIAEGFVLDLRGRQ